MHTCLQKQTSFKVKENIRQPQILKISLEIIIIYLLIIIINLLFHYFRLLLSLKDLVTGGTEEMELDSQPHLQPKNIKPRLLPFHISPQYYEGRRQVDRVMSVIKFHYKHLVKQAQIFQASILSNVALIRYIVIEFHKTAIRSSIGQNYDLNKKRYEVLIKNQENIFDFLCGEFNLKSHKDNPYGQISQEKFQEQLDQIHDPKFVQKYIKGCYSTKQCYQSDLNFGDMMDDKVSYADFIQVRKVKVAQQKLKQTGYVSHFDSILATKGKSEMDQE